MNDIVTEVKPEKKGALITVNGEEQLWFDRSAWLERELREGEAVDLEELRQWLLPRQYPSALNSAVRLLSVRARSALEVRKRLEERRYLDDAVEMVLYKLEKEGLLDDAAFAREWALARSRRQLGKGRILQELRSKGIDRETAERAVSELPQEEGAERAAALAEKLVRRYDGETAETALRKVMAAMARRGYSFDEARDAVANALAKRREDR